MEQEIDFSNIKTYPIHERKNKVSIESFAKLNFAPPKFESKEMDLLAKKIADSHKAGKKVILMMGAHVIKTGMSLYIIDLMKRGIISHVALNGAGSIHDFEIALISATSEDVAANLENGRFGMAEETGIMMNLALNSTDKGYGETIGELILEKNLYYKEYSILYWGKKLSIPVTVHVAIGTDIIHQHPMCSGEAIGRASYKDFKRITTSISSLEQGVVINLGSAVILPEVFLKAFTIARNLGHTIEKFTAANIDMIKHYRPTVNVVERPTSLGGIGLTIIGKHEITVPNLYSRILQNIKPAK